VSRSAARSGARLFRWLVVVSLLAGCAGPPSRVIAPTSASVVTPAPNVSVSVSTDYYSIAGLTADELRAQMDQYGPGEYDAYTGWNVRWLYFRSTVSGGCATGPLTVSVEVTFTLPLWNAPAEAPQALVDRWNAYLAALQLHEDGHKAIGIEVGNEVLRALQDFSAYPSCDELDRAVSATAEHVLNEYRRREEIYDQTTDHGATQGARFP
jgi:predicted secreted Zn-dependent protease